MLPPSLAKHSSVEVAKCSSLTLGNSTIATNFDEGTWQESLCVETAMAHCSQELCLSSPAECHG